MTHPANKQIRADVSLSVEVYSLFLLLLSTYCQCLQLYSYHQLQKDILNELREKDMGGGGLCPSMINITCYLEDMNVSRTMPSYVHVQQLVCFNCDVCTRQFSVEMIATHSVNVQFKLWFNPMESTEFILNTKYFKLCTN